jgi:voltage-gated potassium channel
MRVRLRLQRQMGLLLGMVLGMTFAGTAGYMIVEDWGFVDSLYMTVITLSTVGFKEVAELSTGGRLFTIVLIMAGVGVVAYSLGSIGQYVISGELRGTLRRRRMQRKIDQLGTHVIICGYGRVGRRVLLDLEQQGQGCLVVDQDPDAFRNEHDGILSVVSDASNDEELVRCGIHKARGLVAATGSDATNTFITLTARALNPDLVIVARCNDPATERKLTKAGANHVISPYSIAGHRIATQLMHPSVVDFLDVVMHSGDQEMWLEEVAVCEGADLVGKTLVESDLSRSVGVNILAFRRHGSESTESGPVADTRLEAGDVLIALGTRTQLDSLRRVC